MNAEPATPGRRSSANKRRLLAFAAAALVAAVAGGGYWALACPCGAIPGFVLRGEVQPETVQDWRFANGVSLCQIQINAGWLPHSVNLNCMATASGDLFLSCSAGTRKYWCQHVGPDHPARLRLNGRVYPVVLNRVTDPATLDAAWAARVEKLQRPEVQALQPPGATPAPDEKRPETWWSFQVRSRASI
jgi:hypothetical protein